MRKKVVGVIFRRFDVVSAEMSDEIGAIVQSPNSQSSLQLSYLTISAIDAAVTHGTLKNLVETVTWLLPTPRQP